MRLLVTETREVTEIKEITETLGHSPVYAILSHRWRADEVTLEDLSRSDVQAMEGYSKMSKACEMARDLGFEYLWMDTCCIDRKSSAELSEAINSMYRWYTNSGICLAYIDDVAGSKYLDDFSASVWFSRGWTLQELIAPTEILFFAMDWSLLGTRASLSTSIQEASGIEQKVLLARNFDDLSVAKKMSWASRRVTTRLEDEAYCLMGIFNVNMPVLYGEGRKAFIRLQEEILKQTNDHSIFAWGCRLRVDIKLEHFTTPETRIKFMADKPSLFRDSGDVVGIPFSELESMLGVSDLDREIMPTFKGIRMCIPLKPLRSGIKWAAILACRIKTESETESERRVLGMTLKKLGHHHYTRIGTTYKPLIEVPYNVLLGRDVLLDERACIIRDAPTKKKPALHVAVDISSLRKFFKRLGFFVSQHWKWARHRDEGYLRWTRKPPQLKICSFRVTIKDSESSYLILKHVKDKLRMGFAIAISTEPDAYARGEQHIFSVETHTIGGARCCIPYLGPLESYKKICNSWKRRRDSSLVRSIVSSTILPRNGKRVMTKITYSKDMANTLPNGHPYAGLSYKLTAGVIETN